MKDSNTSIQCIAIALARTPLDQQQTIDRLFHELEANQQLVIVEGMLQSVDYMQYADAKYNWQQMNQIKEGLLRGVDVSLYANPDFDWEQMKAIRHGLEQRFNVSAYAQQGFDGAQIEQIVDGLMNDEDTSIYAHQRYSAEQMQDIRTCMYRYGINLPQWVSHYDQATNNKETSSDDKEY